MSTTATMTAFQWIARAEGLSLLLLFGVAMPLKYLAHHPEPVRWVGSAHGGLFLAYIALLVVVGVQQRWAPPRYALGAIASLVPFGTFVFERFIQQPEPLTQN